jgi:hypothetical protein
LDLTVWLLGETDLVLGETAPVLGETAPGLDEVVVWLGSTLPQVWALYAWQVEPLWAYATPGSISAMLATAVAIRLIVRVLSFHLRLGQEEVFRPPHSVQEASAHSYSASVTILMRALSAPLAGTADGVLLPALAHPEPAAGAG